MKKALGIIFFIPVLTYSQTFDSTQFVLSAMGGEVEVLPIEISESDSEAIKLTEFYDCYLT